MQGNPHNVENVPPESEDTTPDENPERQGPEEGQGPSDAPGAEDAPDQGPSGPPPESVPGGESEGTSPKK